MWVWHTDRTIMATQSISSSPARQAIFAQEKLERIYLQTYGYLRPYKGAIELAQEVLVWKKPIASALLYIVVHWMFVLYVKSSSTLITATGNFIFWGLLGDVLWRAASKDGFHSGNDGNTAERRGGRQESVGVAPRLESALMQSLKPRGPGEFPPFEVICVWLAEAVMWVDNIWLALRHWSLHEPIFFTIALALPGLFLSLLGKYIPTTVFLYTQVMVLLVSPYVEHHCLRERTLTYLSKQYPWVLRKATSMWIFIKTITVNRDRSDDPELSLAQGVSDLRTQFSLHEAFEQVTATPPEQSNDLELPPANQMTTGIGGGLHDVGGASRQVPNQRRAAQQQRTASTDSLTLDSFVGGSEMEFPSLTDLDSSLALGQFPSGDYSIMPTISEQEEPTRTSRQDTSDLDPFLDSMQFGDFHDGRSSNPSSTPSSHPLAQSHRAPSSNPQPSAPPLTSGFNSLGLSMYTSMSGQTGQTGQTGHNFIPPPTYQQVEAGSPDAGVTVDWTPGRDDSLAHRRSSTPNVQENGESFGTKKRSQSGVF